MDNLQRTDQDPQSSKSVSSTEEEIVDRPQTREGHLWTTRTSRRFLAPTGRFSPLKIGTSKMTKNKSRDDSIDEIFSPEGEKKPELTLNTKALLLRVSRPSFSPSDLHSSEGSCSLTFSSSSTPNSDIQYSKFSATMGSFTFSDSQIQNKNELKDSDDVFLKGNKANNFSRFHFPKFSHSIRKRSKSLTNLPTDSSSEDDILKNASMKSFHFPSIFPKHEKDFNGKMSPEVQHFQEDNPAATILVIPQELSGAPAIFLKKDTPSTTPAESPVRNPMVTFASTINGRSLSEGCLNEEDSLVMDQNMASAPGSEDCIPYHDEEIHSQREGDQIRTKKGKKSFYKRMSTLKKKVKRPTLLLPSKDKGDRESPEPSVTRRHSMLSILSVTQTSRRPSLTSLLSVSPSVIGGRRFSFGLGSRVST